MKTRCRVQTCGVNGGSVKAVNHSIDGGADRLPAFDPLDGALYISGVAEQENNVFDAELRQLEARMVEIVRVCDQLKEENRSLKERQEALITERASLLQKNELVRGRVEAMIGRLKSMEHGN